MVKLKKINYDRPLLISRISITNINFFSFEMSEEIKGQIVCCSNFTFFSFRLIRV